MTCDLCGSNDDVNTYGIYPAEIHGPAREWHIDAAHFCSQTYCDACISKARKRNIRHAACVFFLPTQGITRIFKFAQCTKQEMGDLMVASDCAHDRDPLRNHILWPDGAPNYCSLKGYKTRQAARKRPRRPPRTASAASR